jgi:hypothetical protein
MLTYVAPEQEFLNFQEAQESIPPAYVRKAGQWANPTTTLFLATIDCFKIPALDLL